MKKAPMHPLPRVFPSDIPGFLVPATLLHSRKSHEETVESIAQLLDRLMDTAKAASMLPAGVGNVLHLKFIIILANIAKISPIDNRHRGYYPLYNPSR